MPFNHPHSVSLGIQVVVDMIRRIVALWLPLGLRLTCNQMSPPLDLPFVSPQMSAKGVLKYTVTEPFRSF